MIIATPGTAATFSGYFQFNRNYDFQSQPQVSNKTPFWWPLCVQLMQVQLAIKAKLDQAAEGKTLVTPSHSLNVLKAYSQFYSILDVSQTVE